MPDLTEPLTAIVLVVLGVLAGFVNTLAGAGSLIMVPALMLLGLPAGVANATSRVAVFAQSTSGAVGFARAGRLHTRCILDVVPATVLGALAGAYAATRTPDHILKPLLLATMVVAAFALLWRPEALAPTTPEAERRVGFSPGFFLVLFAAGFYGGLVQAGVGLVLIAILGGVLRYDLIRGNALKTVIVAIYTIPTLAIFILNDLIQWRPGLLLALGNILGATLAVRFAVRFGSRAIRYVILFAVLATCTALIIRQLS